MANVILFTDIIPKSTHGDNLNQNLDFYNRPIGVYSLASQLRRSGYTVIVVPNASVLSKKGIIDFISRNDKDLLWIGISTTFFTALDTNLEKYRTIWHSSDSFFIDTVDLITPIDNQQPIGFQMVWGVNELNTIANFIDKNYPKSVILVGGSFVTRSPGRHFSNLHDKIHLVHGNAELLVSEVSYSISTPSQLREVNRKTGHYELIQNNNNNKFDNIDFKNTIVHFAEQDFIDSNEWLPIEVSRGCAFNCAYCAYDKKNTTDNYKIDTLYIEILENYEKYGTTKYIILDDLYNDDLDKIKILYDKVWSRLPFTPEWVSYIRLDLLWAWPESAEILKASGCKLASFGIETLHNIAGKKVGKGLGKERILETLSNLKNVWGDDVVRQGMFIAGLPHEPKESILETIEWLKNTDLLHSYEFYPHHISPPLYLKTNPKIPFTTISKDNEKYGITWDNQGWINDVGVTWNIARELAQQAMRNRPNNFSLTKGHYVGLRSLGLNHSETLAMRHNLEFNTVMSELVAIAKEKVNFRVNNIFNLTEKE